MTDPGRNRSAIDEMLDRAVRAINSGDRATADALAGRVLAFDHANVDAEELLAAPADHGELRRITILFADLVDSTALSTRIEPETYRTVVGHYRDEVIRLVNEYEGHIGNTKGDGLLAVFGHPIAHEDDVRRAVQSGLDITRAVARLSERVQRRFGFDIDVRVGIHRGLVYLDTAQDDVYGFAANLAARMCSIAEPGTVAVSEAVERLIRDTFHLERGAATKVKGVEAEVIPFRVVTEREMSTPAMGPLVGRQREVLYLESALEMARAGTLHIPGVAFCGDPGIGKSRLARAAITMAERSDDIVLQVFGSPFHTDVGLHPIRKLLERRCGITRAATPHDRLAKLRSELESQRLNAENLVPWLAPVLGLGPEVGYDPAPAEGHKLHELITAAVTEYLLACSTGRCGVIVAEDMHWYDPSTTDVVRALLSSKTGGILVVMTSRELHTLPGDRTESHVFQLDPLTDNETDVLVSALHPDMSAAARDTVRRRCDGVPLYIEEVVAKLKAQPDEGGESTTVPDSLYEALFARLRSSEADIRVIQAAATIGSTFDHTLLAAVVEADHGQLDGVLDALRDHAVLEQISGDSWRFRHELLREVAAELAPPSIRQRLHGQVADALIAAASQDWPLIANHFEQAHRFDDAVSAYRQASAVARQRGALDEARRYLDRALQQFDRLSPGPDRDELEMDLRLRHGFLVAAADGPGSAETAADFERCLQLCGTDPDADGLFATLMALFTYYVTRADFMRARQIVDSLRFGVDAGREWWRAENLGGAATVAWFAGDFAEALEKQEQADRLLVSRGQRDVDAEWFMPHDPIVLGLCSLGLARWTRGDTCGADEALARSESRATELKFPQGPFSLCYLRYPQIWIALESGCLDRAAELAADMTERAERYGFDQWRVLGMTFMSLSPALAALEAGRGDGPEISAAIGAVSAWVQACRFLGATVFVPSFDGHLARLHIAAGRPAEARVQIDAGLRLAEQTGMHFYDAELLRLRAATHDEAEARRGDLGAAFELARRQGAAVFAMRAALDAHELSADTRLLQEAAGMLPSDSGCDELQCARTILATP